MWSVTSVVNIVIMAASMVLCRVMSWETKKQKKSLARSEPLLVLPINPTPYLYSNIGLEMVRDQNESCAFR